MLALVKARCRLQKKMNGVHKRRKKNQSRELALFLSAQFGETHMRNMAPGADDVQEKEDRKHEEYNVSILILTHIHVCVRALGFHLRAFRWKMHSVSFLKTGQ